MSTFLKYREKTLIYITWHKYHKNWERLRVSRCGQGLLFFRILSLLFRFFKVCIFIKLLEIKNYLKTHKGEVKSLWLNQKHEWSETVLKTAFGKPQIQRNPSSYRSRCQSPDRSNDALKFRQWRSQTCSLCSLPTELNKSPSLLDPFYHHLDRSKSHQP